MRIFDVRQRSGTNTFRASILAALLALIAAGFSANDEISMRVSVSSNRKVQFTYSLRADGYVTLVIDDANGHRIRNLIGAAPRRSGSNTEVWDGTDEAGNVVSPGDYRWRVLRHNGIGAEYVMSYGNPGTPPWATADGKGGWGADHTSPQAAVATPSGVVLGWPTAEAGWFLIGVGPDGHKEWGLKNRFAFGDTRVNLAVDDQYLYVASEQNAAPLMKYYKKLAHAVLYRYRLSDHRLAKLGGADEVVVTDQMDGNVRGLAIAGSTAYVALQKENKIAAVSLTNGQLEPANDISVDRPAGVAVSRSGSLLVISGRKLLRFDPKSRESRILISDGLDNPQGICIDSAATIYIADRGKAQQVKVFAPDGKFQRTIGFSGGRPPRGRHVREGMYQPLGLAVDGQGLLWVVEEDDRPKRISVWNASTGAFVREYVGGPHYGALDGSIADFNKSMAFAEGVQYRLDWDRKTSAFSSTASRAVNDEDVFGRATIRRIFQRNGRILTASNTHVQVIGELRDGALHPLAALGDTDELTRRLGLFTGAISRKLDQLKASGAKLDAHGNPTPAAAFIWTDQNGDGIAQDSEFVWRDNFRWGGYWGTSVADDFTVYMQSSGKIYRLPVTGWNRYSAPVYTFDSATTIRYAGTAEHVGASPDGMLIVNAKPQLLGIDSKMREQKWSYPNPWEGVQGSHRADMPAPGRLIGPLSITGFATLGGPIGTLFAMNGNLGQQFLMTSDGLWVAAMLRDWRLSKVEDMYTVPDEDFGGYFWRDQKSGEVYLEAGKTEYRLYRITGLESIRRSEGDFTFSPQLASAATANKAKPQALRENVPSVAIPKLATAPKISGRLEDVPPEMHFTEVAADPGSMFRFALGHDAQNLYLVYDVIDDTPFQNTGQNEKQMFNSGDCVDVMLATDPSADPRRKQGVAGDSRLLITVKDQKPIALLYRQVDPGRNSPVPFLSPSRAIYFGSVSKLQDAAIAVTRRKTGYVLTASVPLATLGINPERAGSFLAGDVGVIFGSESGNGARLRLYWANKSTAITSDVPSEAALDPENWGRFQFE